MALNSDNRGNFGKCDNCPASNNELKRCSMQGAILFICLECLKQIMDKRGKPANTAYPVILED